MKAASAARAARAAGRLLPAVLALVHFGAKPAPAADLKLVVADWRAAAFGREAAGLLAWVSGPGGELRLDLLASEPGPQAAPAGATDDRREALLWRQGRGWTLVAGAGADAGLLEPWGREWRPAPPGLADLARAVAGAVPGRARGLALAEAAVDDPDATAAPGAGLRQALVRRGRGGGGPGERVTVGGGAGGLVRVRSSRRPGELEIRPNLSLAVAADPGAVYAPWWPLGEVLPGLPAWPPPAGTPAADRR